jgi:hypothetical protein
MSSSFFENIKNRKRANSCPLKTNSIEENKAYKPNFAFQSFNN